MLRCARPLWFRGVVASASSPGSLTDGVAAPVSTGTLRPFVCTRPVSPAAPAQAVCAAVPPSLLEAHLPESSDWRSRAIFLDRFPLRKTVLCIRIQEVSLYMQWKKNPCFKHVPLFALFSTMEIFLSFKMLHPVLRY